MHGFLFGLLGALGIAWLARRVRRYGRYYGRHCGGGHGAHEGRGGFGGRMRRRYRRRMMWWIFERLETTPGQERMIREELERVFEQAHASREAMRGIGSGLGAAVRAESLDEKAAFAALAAAEGESLTKMREVLAQAMARIHEVLDSRQRVILAELLETRLGSRGRHEGPYRS